MNGAARAKLVDLFARTYSRDQLDMMVRRILKRPLEYYTTAPDLLTIVDRLVGTLELSPPELMTFLLSVRECFNQPQIRGAVNAYLGIPDSSPEAYDALEVFEEPFVNRQLFRRKLEAFFQKRKRALVSRGPRGCGKTHSRWLAQHAANAEGIESIYIDLEATSPSEIVLQVVNEMSLPAKEFHDRLAPFATIGNGFVTALRGCCRTILAGQRWCLIFDSYDSDKVAQDRRDFVDALLLDVATLQLPSIWIVILGHRPSPSPLPGSTTLTAKLIIDDILPLTKPDVYKFMKAYASTAGQNLSDDRAATLVSEVFGALVPPLDPDGMMSMSTRLKERLPILRGEA